MQIKNCTSNRSSLTVSLWLPVDGLAIPSDELFCLSRKVRLLVKIYQGPIQSVTSIHDCENQHPHVRSLVAWSDAPTSLDLGIRFTVYHKTEADSDLAA